MSPEAPKERAGAADMWYVCFLQLSNGDFHPSAAFLAAAFQVGTTFCVVAFLGYHEGGSRSPVAEPAFDSEAVAHIEAQQRDIRRPGCELQQLDRIEGGIELGGSRLDR